MKVRIRLDTAAARAKLDRVGRDIAQRTRLSVGRALRKEAPVITEAVRDHVGERLAVVRPVFKKSFRAQVLDRRLDRLPALRVSSRVPWVGIHERGGAISGPLLIPLFGRVGRKRFKAIVTGLMRGGNAYFVRGRRHVVLMAENIREHDALLSGFKRRFRKDHGIGRLKRGADIPIAVLVPRVALRKRLDVERLALASVPRIARALHLELNRP
jgi:hypothetical protein